MSPRTEYLEAMTRFGTPAFAALSFALCFVVFGASLVIMALISKESMAKRARLPLDPQEAEANHD